MWFKHYSEKMGGPSDSEFEKSINMLTRDRVSDFSLEEIMSAVSKIETVSTAKTSLEFNITLDHIKFAPVLAFKIIRSWMNYYLDKPDKLIWCSKLIRNHELMPSLKSNDKCAAETKSYRPLTLMTALMNVV